MAIVTVRGYENKMAATLTNRYMVSEDHGEVPCIGHLCPSDAVGASSCMESIRASSEAVQEPQNGKPAHYHLYMSWADDEKPEPMEMLAMADELIQRTALRDYCCFAAAHTNAAQHHVHISVCPFPMEDRDMLDITTDVKHDIWRQADYICAEHGYSIVATPSLREDVQYEDWFSHILQEGKITVHSMREMQQSRPLDEQIRDAGQRAPTQQVTAQNKERADR